jgi:hypothetical protein
MAKPTAPQAAKPAHKTTVSVTYRPLDIGDPHVMKWNGITFNANVPVELDPKNPAHQVMQLLPTEIPGPNGEVLKKFKETPMFMGDMARNNPGFEVDGVRCRRRVNTRKVPPPGAEWTEAHEGQVSYSDEIDASVTA